MSDSDGYRDEIGRVEDVLVRAEEIDGLVLAAQAPGGVFPESETPSGETEYRATIATRDGNLNVPVLLGNVLFAVARNTGMHPAVLGHMMIQNALDLAEHDEAGR